MNRTQIVDSDNEADESMLIPKKAAKGGSSKQNRQQRHQKTGDTSSANDSNSMNSDSDETSDSPEEKEEETGTSASSRVSDFLCVSLRMGTDIAMKVENHRRCLKATTKDLRICGKDGKGSHPFKNISVDGWYCKFCL